MPVARRPAGARPLARPAQARLLARPGQTASQKSSRRWPGLVCRRPQATVSALQTRLAPDLVAAFPLAHRTIGSRVHGAPIVSLRHRLDCRVGAAASAYLKRSIEDPALRMEALAALHFAYWRWPTQRLIDEMIPATGGSDNVPLSATTPRRRAQRWKRAWNRVVRGLARFQVVCDESAAPGAVALAPRVSGSQRRKEPARRRYHPVMNPSTRRTGYHYFLQLWPFLRDGSLLRACQEVANAAATGALSYVRLLNVFGEHCGFFGSIGAARGRARCYMRVRFCRWLAFAEGFDLEIGEADWAVFVDMGDGAATGARINGANDFNVALAICEKLRLALGDRDYNLSDLVCFLCLSRHKEALAFPVATLPPRAARLSVYNDLGLDEHPATLWPARALRRPLRWRRGALGDSAASGASCGDSGAAPGAVSGASCEESLARSLWFLSGWFSDRGASWFSVSTSCRGLWRAGGSGDVVVGELPRLQRARRRGSFSRGLSFRLSLANQEMDDRVDRFFTQMDDAAAMAGHVVFLSELYRARACALDIVAAALGAEPWVQSLCCDGDARARGLFALAIVRIGVKLEMNDANAVADSLCYEEFAETRSRARVGVTRMEARLLRAPFFGLARH